MTTRLAIATALALLPLHAAQAVVSTLDLDVYLAGSLRYQEGEAETSAQEDQFEGVNNGTNLSLTGAFKWPNSRVFATYERGLRNDKIGIEQVRQVYGGIDSVAGHLHIGKLINEYRAIGQKVDPFYDTAIVGFNARAYGEGASYGLSNLNNAFSRNAVTYKTPFFESKIQFNAGAFFNDKDAPNDEIDYTGGFIVTLPGEQEGTKFTAALQYLEIKNPASFAVGNTTRNEMLGVGGSPGISNNTHFMVAYTTPKASFGANYENVDVKAETRPRRYSAISTTIAAGEKNRIAALVGYLDFPGQAAIEGKGYALGFFRKISETGNFYLAARHIELDNDNDQTGVAMGMSFNFGFNLLTFGADAAAPAAAPAAEAE